MQTPDHKKPSTPPPPPGATPKGPPPGVPPTTAAPTNGTHASTAPNKDDDKTDENEGSDETKETNRSKFYIVVGEIHEFPTAAKAEAFLNQPNGPKQFAVIRGHKVESKQKVTLR